MAVHTGDVCFEAYTGFVWFVMTKAKDLRFVENPAASVPGGDASAEKNLAVRAVLRSRFQQLCPELTSGGGIKY